MRQQQQQESQNWFGATQQKQQQQQESQNWFGATHGVPQMGARPAPVDTRATGYQMPPPVYDPQELVAACKNKFKAMADGKESMDIHSFQAAFIKPLDPEYPKAATAAQLELTQRLF